MAEETNPASENEISEIEEPEVIAHSDDAEDEFSAGCVVNNSKAL
jgi:hypothetical protein